MGNVRVWLYCQIKSPGLEFGRLLCDFDIPFFFGVLTSFSLAAYE